MKTKLRFLAIVALLCGLRGAASAGSQAALIATVAYPSFADGAEDGTPFAVHVSISGWTAAADSDAYIKVNRTGSSGPNYRIWNGTSWGNAYYYANGPRVHIDATGSWQGWVFVKANAASTNTFDARARTVGKAKSLDEDSSHLVTYLSMSTTGAWVHGTAVAGAAGKAVLAYDASGYLIGSYVIEDNGVDEGYPSTAGYFKIAVPANTAIRTLEARNADNTTFAIQTSSLWRSGVAGSDTDLDAQQDVSLPVSLAYFKAAAEPAAVILSWATESELNNQGFYVLRSQRQEEGFAVISPLIPGAGTSPMGQSYQYIDRSVLPATWYWYRLQQVDFGGGVALFAPLAVLVPQTGSTLESLPRTAGLLAPHPNPFVPGTQLGFTLPAEEVVSVAVYDLQGRLTRVVVQGKVPAGEHRAWWDGRDEHGAPAPPGVYFCRLRCADGFSQAVKMVKLR